MNRLLLLIPVLLSANVYAGCWEPIKPHPPSCAKLTYPFTNKMDQQVCERQFKQYEKDVQKYITEINEYALCNTNDTIDELNKTSTKFKERYDVRFYK